MYVPGMYMSIYIYLQRESRESRERERERESERVRGERDLYVFLHLHKLSGQQGKMHVAPAARRSSWRPTVSGPLAS